MSETDTQDEPLSRADAARAALVEAILPHAAFDGWGPDALAAALEETGLSEGEFQLYCPRGVLDLIETWSRAMDKAAEDAIRSADIEAMRVRDRVAFCVLARLEAIGRHEEAARRARARLSLPDAAADGARLAWASCDTVWRAIGDQSTDFNFYTKRAILMGVYATTLGVWLNDETDDKAKARAFLANRIENVMQYEKAKWRVRKVTDKFPDPIGLAAKLRFGFGRRV